MIGTTPSHGYRADPAAGFVHFRRNIVQPRRSNASVRRDRCRSSRHEYVRTAAKQISARSQSESASSKSPHPPLKEKVEEILDKNVSSLIQTNLLRREFLLRAVTFWQRKRRPAPLWHLSSGATRAKARRSKFHQSARSWKQNCPLAIRSGHLPLSPVIDNIVRGAVSGLVVPVHGDALDFCTKSAIDKVSIGFVPRHICSGQQIRHADRARLVGFFVR